MLKWLKFLLPHIHTWSSWELYKQGAIVDDDGERIGDYFNQRRKCASCGLTEFKQNKVW